MQDSPIVDLSFGEDRTQTKENYMKTKTWTMPTVAETNVGLEVTSYASAEIDII